MTTRRIYRTTYKHPTHCGICGAMIAPRESFISTPTIAIDQSCIDEILAVDQSLRLAAVKANIESSLNQSAGHLVPLSDKPIIMRSIMGGTIVDDNDDGDHS